MAFSTGPLLLILFLLLLVHADQQGGQVEEAIGGGAGDGGEQSELATVLETDNDGKDDGEGPEEGGGGSTPMPADAAPSSPSPSRLQEHQSQQLFSLSKKFQLVCCMGGVPQLSHPELVRNFTFQSVSYVVDRDGEGAAGILEPAGCRLFKGSFLLPQPSLLFGVSVELSYAAHVVCKCPQLGMGHALDRSCRQLPNCQNNGFRSLLDPRRCFCLEPFFGERCEKLCDRGRRMRGSDGRDHCSCAPFFRGDECRQAICINGGRALSDGTGCECPPHFLGFHCEIDANRTQPAGLGRHDFVGGSSSRFHQRFGPEQGGEMFSRDVSGTVFSLVMIVVLVLSMYLLMKHRMQVQTRYLSSRRADLLGACNFQQPTPAMSTIGTNTAGATGIAPGHARRVELLPIGGGDHQGRAFPPFVRALAPFFASDGGPPPYAPPGQRVRRSRNEALPPLPSYEDATKLPALRTAALVVEEQQEGGEQQQQQEDGQQEAVVVNEAGDAVAPTNEEEEGGGGREERRRRRSPVEELRRGSGRMAEGGREEQGRGGEEEELVMLEMEERGGGRQEAEEQQEERTGSKL